MLMIIPDWGGIGISVSAEMIYQSITVNQGDTKQCTDLDIFDFGSGTVIINNGTFIVSNNLQIYDAAFKNEGEMIFTGDIDDYSTFSLGGTANFVNNGTVTVNGAFNLGVQSGTTFTNNGTLFLENVQSYNFEGFINSGTVVIGDNVNAHIAGAISGGTVLTKDEYENSSKTYTITYVLGSASVDNKNNPKTYEYKNNAAAQVTIADPERDGYDFIGWLGAGLSVSTKDFSFSSDIQENITLTACWRPTVWSITYDLDGGQFGGSVKNTYTIADEDFTLPEPVKTGYTFSGWTGSNGSTPARTVTVSSGSKGDRSYTANYIANTDTTYKVICYYENLDGGYDAEEHIYTGTTGETVFAKWSDYYKNHFKIGENSPAQVFGEVAADNSLELKLYYERIRYGVIYHSNNMIIYETKRPYGSKVGEYGGDIPQKDSDDLYNYEFAGWAFPDDADKTVMDDSARENYTVNGSVHFDAVFKPVRDYSRNAVIKWGNTKGFKNAPSGEVMIPAGTDYRVELELENEKYYVGTKEWLGDGFPMFRAIGVKWYDPATGDHPADYTAEFADGVVVLTIPNVRHDIDITIEASYHEEHDYSSEFDTVLSGNCEDGFVVRRFCYMCGKTYEETLQQGSHVFGSGFSYDDEFHYQECGTCGYRSQNAHTSDGGTVTRYPTETEKGEIEYRCTVCGYLIKTEEIDVNVHVHSGNLKSDASGHWRECGECGESFDFAAHELRSEVTVQPTETTEGVRTYLCGVCGYIDRTESIPPAGSGDIPTVPTVPYYPTDYPLVLPYNPHGNGEPYIVGNDGKIGWEAIESEIDSIGEGGTVNINMNGTTKLPKDITKIIRDKDITLKLDMGGGIVWSINGMDVTNPKTVNLRVRKNRNKIPVDIINTVSGENYTMQLSLAQNGDFGFTATLSVKLGTKNDGLFANLFHYNKKLGEMEFTCCDEIESGFAELVFTHASEYAIIISAESAGYEDVSADAGAYADEASVSAEDKRFEAAPNKKSKAKK